MGRYGQGLVTSDFLAWKHSRTSLHGVVGRKLSGARLRVRGAVFRRHLRIEPRDDLVELGDSDSRYTVPDRLLGPHSTCYLAGVGEDISFDLAVISRYGCTVHAFDPVPAAQDYAARAGAAEPRFVFHPVGLWSADTQLAFHSPAVDGFISHSATDLHTKPVAFAAPVRSVSSLMRELGHTKLDLLKISAEGAEHEIVRGLLEDRVNVSVLCIELAQPARRGASERTVETLRDRGYETVAAHVRSWNWRLTLVRS